MKLRFKKKNNRIKLDCFAIARNDVNYQTFNDNIKNKIKAFTLAEILIVLSVIAIITAILLPVARNAMPNEDIVKFKKGHNTVTTAI